MKNKIFIFFIFAAFGLAMQGCGPETTITGMVWEDQAGQPVPGAAVLAMVWLEDADKALKKPVIESPEERYFAMDRDMQQRGQPSAYARGFTDNNGRFTLDKFHFSAKTREKAGRLKNPVVTRVTVIAFGKGYLKTAATMFPENDDDSALPVLLYAGKPKDWYDLYGQNTAEALTEEYMRNGYSVDYGATKKEKAWMLAYTQSNLWKAYVESDIKGNKRYENICGHDYSDVIISSAGMQRNPAREKCAEVLREMGAIRQIEDKWLVYDLKNKTWSKTVKELVEAAIAALPAECHEPKLYETEILSGIEQADKAENAVDVGKAGYRNGISNMKPEKKATLADAQNIYNRGDRAGAYKAVGGTIYRAISSAVPGEDARIRLGAKSGQIKGGAAVNPVNTGATITEIENSLALAGSVSADGILAGIGRGLAGFHILMTRPQTAQLPGGDDGNHKDKPGIKESTETVTTDNVPIEEYVPKVIIEGKWGTGPGEFGMASRFPLGLYDQYKPSSPPFRTSRRQYPRISMPLTCLTRRGEAVPQAGEAPVAVALSFPFRKSALPDLGAAECSALPG